MRKWRLAHEKRSRQIASAERDSETAKAAQRKRSSNEDPHHRQQTEEGHLLEARHCSRALCSIAPGPALSGGGSAAGRRGSRLAWPVRQVSGETIARAHASERASARGSATGRSTTIPRLSTCSTSNSGGSSRWRERVATKAVVKFWSSRSGRRWQALTKPEPPRPL